MAGALRKRVRPVLLLSAATLVTGLLLPRSAGPDASACSRNDNYRPTVSGCVRTVGQACYECQYSYPGGYSDCVENEAGDVAYCIDYQY